MASSSDAARCARALGLLAVATLWQGCITGALFDAGRRTETVVSFEEAYTDGDHLWLVYATETANRQGEAVGHGSRTAAVALGDLDPARGLPLDALPLERRALIDPASEALRPVAVQRPQAAPRARPDEPTLRVEEQDGRATGFSLVAFAGLPPDAHFHAGSLVDRETAGWVYPLLPLAVAADAVAVPPTLIFAIPFFVIGD